MDEVTTENHDVYFTCPACGIYTNDPYTTRTGQTLCWDCFNLVE